MGKYVLIGIPFCGTSTLGQRLAEALQIPFFDTEMIAYSKVEFEYPMEIYLPSSQDRIETAQYNAMLEITEMEGPAVIVTTPEMPLMPRVVETLKSIGSVIHLRRDAELVLAELRKRKERGPVLVEKETGDEFVLRECAVRVGVKKLWQYEMAADYSIDNNGSEEEGLEKLLALIQSLSAVRKSE